MRSLRHYTTALALVSALLSVPAPGGAVPSDGDLEQELTALMNAGRIQDARALLLSRAPDDADLLLFDGRVLKLQQNFAASADLLEQALRQRPSDIIIRRELAHVLFLAKRYQPAKTHLNKLLRQDPDPDLRRRYVSTLKEIRDTEKLSFGLSFALEPSTNITNGASAEYFHTPTASFRIDDASRETSGLGVTLALTSEYSARQTDQGSLSLDFGVTATRYSVSQANRKDLYEIGVTYTVFHALSHFEIRPYLQEQMTAGQPDQTNLGISLDWTRKLSPSGDLNAGLTSERQSKDRAAKRVGIDSKLHMSYKHYLSQRAALQFGVLLEHNTTGLAHHQYQGHRLDLSFDYAYQSGLLSHTRLSLGHRDFTGDFPLLTIARADEYLEFVAQVQKNDWHLFGFSPIATCKHVRNRSNVSLYTYDSTSCTGRLSKEF